MEDSGPLKYNWSIHPPIIHLFKDLTGRRVLIECKPNIIMYVVFAWLWLVVGADLLWENITADWLVAGAWCWFSMRE